MPPRRLLLVALIAALAVRIPALLLGMDHYGDAAVRVEIAERWARAPHLWRGFVEAYQYGPLHLSLIGTALRIWPDRLWAPRVLSLACGLLGIWLLFRVAHRFAGPQAAFVSALALALSPLHIQASTTAASEAPFLALLLGCIDLLLSDRLVASAVLLGASGLVRYDGWLYIPLLAGWLVLRRVALSRIALYVVLAAAPAVFWLWVNQRYAGDALAPIHHIDRDHRALTDVSLAYFGQFRWRAYCLVYWPLAVLLVCTPVLGAFAIAGAARALWRRSAGWQLAALAWIPAAYFTFRAALLTDFRPLRLVLLGGGSFRVTARLAVVVAQGTGPSDPPFAVPPEHSSYLPPFHHPYLLRFARRFSTGKKSRTPIPSACASRSNIVTVGDIWSFSIRTTVA